VPSRYVPLSRPPKGAWARHIQAKRQEWGWSQQHAFEQLREGLHLGPKSRASYVKIDEGGRQPTADEAAYLASVFGWPEPEPEAEPSADVGVGALVGAITALVEELRLARLRQETFDEHVLELLAAVAGGRRDPEAPPSDSARAAPAGTAR
jgi:hypothetical protein